MAQRLSERFLELDPLPTAVITTDESTAHVLLAHFNVKHIRVPSDVSMACYGGTFLSEFGPVPLTCVAQPFEPMAHHLIDLVASAQTGKARNGYDVRLLPPKLLIRNSVARLEQRGLPGKPGRKSGT